MTQKNVTYIYKSLMAHTSASCDSLSTEAGNVIKSYHKPIIVVSHARKRFLVASDTPSVTTSKHRNQLLGMIKDGECGYYVVSMVSMDALRNVYHSWPFSDNDTFDEAVIMGDHVNPKTLSKKVRELIA